MENRPYHIAVLVTCHNRKTKTLAALRTLFTAVNKYNDSGSHQVVARLYLTDDGCTDGTVNDVMDNYSDQDIRILQGDGNLFWAGGMRLAWQTALNDNRSWDFYLLINDDTIFHEDALTELIHTHDYALHTYSKGGVYAGIVCSMDGSEITYGGKRYANGIFGKSTSILPNGKPQECLMTNANILLVSQNIVDEIGILSDSYRHSCADWAYGIDANRAGFPVLVTGKICGRCDNDHDSEEQERKKILAMTIRQRWNYFSSPVHSTLDILTFMGRYNRLKFIFVIIARCLNIIAPNLYYNLSRRRNVL